MSAARPVAAFFDLDGTLLAAPSLEWRFIGYLLSRDEISSAHVWHWLAHLSKVILRNRPAAIACNKHYLDGLRESLVGDWKRSGFASMSPFLSEGIRAIEWHRAHLHRIVLISGTLAPLARALAKHLPDYVEICATELEVLDGCWTGWLSGEHMTGEAKARAIRSLASKDELNLSQCYAYGNEMTDFPMLACVGHPVVVNPSMRIAQRAAKLGWPVRRWNDTRLPSSIAQSRQLAAKVAR